MFPLGLLEGTVRHTIWELHLLAGQKVFNGEELETRVLPVEVFGLVKAGGHRLSGHRFGQAFQGDEDPDGGLFPIEHPLEITDLVDGHMAAFYLDNDFFGFVAVIVKKVDVAIDA